MGWGGSFEDVVRWWAAVPFGGGVRGGRARLVSGVGVDRRQTLVLWSAVVAGAAVGERRFSLVPAQTYVAGIGLGGTVGGSGLFSRLPGVFFPGIDGWHYRWRGALAGAAFGSLVRLVGSMGPS